MDKAIDIVRQLAAALSVPAEKVWDALVASQTAGSWAVLINILIGLSAGGGTAWLSVRAFRSADPAKKDTGYMFCSLSAVILLTTLIGAASNMREMIIGFAAPEAGAVLEILSKLGK